MVKIDEAVVAKIEKKGHKFEVLVDPDLAMDVKHGKAVNFEDLLADDKIFKDCRKGDEQSPDLLTECFGTTDVFTITKKIIQDGDVQLTTDQRRAFIERKRREIINMIMRNAINPQTNSPHPQTRIENAMEQAKVHIDAFKSSEEQMREIVDAIRRIIPISMEKIHFAIKIPAAYAGRCSSIIHKFEIKKEDWLNDGSLAAEFILPVGSKQDLLNELNSATHGDLILKDLGKA